MYDPCDYYFIEEDERVMWENMSESEKNVFGILCDWRSPDNRLDYMELARRIARAIEKYDKQQA
jgi:hypothetical protein